MVLERGGATLGRIPGFWEDSGRKKGEIVIFSFETPVRFEELGENGGFRAKLAKNGVFGPFLAFFRVFWWI